MENKEQEGSEQYKDLAQPTDVLCDVCMESTQRNYAVLSAHWGSGSKHDGEQYDEPYRVCRRLFYLS